MKQKDLEKQLVRVHDWIKSVDQKISVALVLEIGIVALLSRPMTAMLSELYPSVSTSQALLAALIIFLFGYAVFKAVWALKPRTKMPKRMTSLIFFESIAGMSLKDYSKKVTKLSVSDYEEDLKSQIHISSVIARTKHRSLAMSLRLLIAGVALWLILTAWVGYTLLP